MCREERVSVTRMYSPARVVTNAVMRMKLRRRLLDGEEVVDAARKVTCGKDIALGEGL